MSPTQTQTSPPPTSILDGRQADILAATLPLLNSTEVELLLSSVGELGADLSSEHFTKRTKNIAYVLCLNEQWYQLRAHCFTQSEGYNDFSGGYKRCYREMPVEFLECPATQKVLNAFKLAYSIPDNQPILVQVQTSHVTSENAGQCLTGQGIHTDGADRAMLLCLERNDIEGAENAIYGDLEGKESLIEPFILTEGHAMVWQDNQVFHDVRPARVKGSRTEGSRTVLIAHYPAVHYLTGTMNPQNSLGTNIVQEDKRLRERVAA